MNTAKIAISLDARMLRRLDSLVKTRVFPSRSAAIQNAVTEKLDRLDRTGLARECAKLSPSKEMRLAEEGFAADAAAWPEY